MKIHKLAIDRETGRIVSIRDVPNGLSCGCICPHCKEPLIAIQGDRIEWHFRHQGETNCKGGQETALHQLAKKIIMANYRIELPNYGTVIYENPCTEKRFQRITPDVTAKTNGEYLFFEILVTHPVDEPKEIFYRDGEYKSIEINLKNYVFTTKEDLSHDVLSNIRNKRVIYWVKKAAAPASPDYSWVLWIAIVILGYFGLKWLFKQTRAYSYHRL